jgi:hypothetical protein
MWVGDVYMYIFEFFTETLINALPRVDLLYIFLANCRNSLRSGDLGDPGTSQAQKLALVERITTQLWMLNNYVSSFNQDIQILSKWFCNKTRLYIDIF